MGMPRAASVDQRCVGPDHRIATEMSLGGPGLVGDDGERIARVHQCSEALDDAVEHANLVRVKRGRDGAGFFVAHDVDERAVAVEERKARRFGKLHGGAS